MSKRNKKSPIPYSLRLSPEERERLTDDASTFWMRVRDSAGALPHSFKREYTRHMNELRSKHNAKRIALEKELKSLVIREDEMIEAICNGFANEALKIKMHANEARQKEIKAILENSEEIKVMMHPSIAQQYHKEVRGLITSLNTSERRQEAAALIRSLIDKIVLTPDQNKESLIVDLHGDLAGILSISMQGRYDKAEQKMLFDQITELAENAEEGGNPDMQDKMVAGGRTNLSENDPKMVVCSTCDRNSLYFTIILSTPRNDDNHLIFCNKVENSHIQSRSKPEGVYSGRFYTDAIIKLTTRPEDYSYRSEGLSSPVKTL